MNGVGVMGLRNPGNVESEMSAHDLNAVPRWPMLLSLGHVATPTIGFASRLHLLVHVVHSNCAAQQTQERAAVLSHPQGKPEQYSCCFSSLELFETNLAFMARWEPLIAPHFPLQTGAISHLLLKITTDLRVLHSTRLTFLQSVVLLIIAFSCNRFSPWFPAHRASRFLF